MTASASRPVGWRRLLTPRAVIVGAVALAALVALANAHLVWVAVATKPDCVAPESGADIGYRPAKPGC